MTTTYVSLKSQLTRLAGERADLQMYRTRLVCACTETKNRRNGILLADDDLIVTKLIKCKTCAKTKGGVL